MPGRGGGAADARPGAGAGGGLAGGGGASGRHGPADLRDWVHRYNTEGLPGLHDRRRGPRPRLTPGQEAELEARRGAGAGPRTGRRGALAPGRPEGPDRGPLRGPAARALGRQGPAPARLRRVSVRPKHPKADEAAQEAFKKASPSWSARRFPSSPGKPVEVWFLDEARVGRQGTRPGCGRRGTRPRAPRDLATRLGLPVRRGLPRARRRRRPGPALRRHGPPGLHSPRSAARSRPGRTPWSCRPAGWHGAGDLAVPGNLTLLPLPSYSPG